MFFMVARASELDGRGRWRRRGRSELHREEVGEGEINAECRVSEGCL
jgi:hypothetical protein